jgi:hypothetical protein
MKTLWVLIFALCLPLAAQAKKHHRSRGSRTHSVKQVKAEKRCYTLSEKKTFRADDPKLPLLCITKDQKISKNSKTRFISVKKRIGRAGLGTSDYVAQIKYAPNCRSCNRKSFKLVNVNYDSPYLVFNGKGRGSHERGYVVFRGEGYYYASTSRL